MRTFFVSLIFALFLQGSALAADDVTDAKAAFRAAYASYNAAVEAGDADAALTAATEALELGPQVFADDSPSLAALYVNRGNALLDAERPKDAIADLRKGIKRFVKLFGKEDERLLDPIFSLAEAYGTIHEQSKRAIQIGRYRNIVKKVYGEESLEYAQASQELGEASYQSFDRQEKAGGYFKEAYELFERIYQEPSYKTGLAAFWLGKAEFQQRRRRQAETHFKAALDYFEKTAPPGHQLQLMAHSFLINLYEDMGKSDQATLHCQAIARIRPKTEVDGYTPIYRKIPVYPRTAVMAGKEGYVLVEFTVTKSGTVAGLTVVETQGHGSFRKAALDAVEKFRYAPAIRNGELVETPGVRNLITFEMTGD